MNWNHLISDLRSTGLTYQEIADLVGMSKGGVHDLQHKDGKTVTYENGVSLVRAHEKIMRRARKSKPSKQKAEV